MARPPKDDIGKKVRRLAGFDAETIAHKQRIHRLLENTTAVGAYALGMATVAGLCKLNEYPPLEVLKRCRDATSIREAAELIDAWVQNARKAHDAEIRRNVGGKPYVPGASHLPSVGKR